MSTTTTTELTMNDRILNVYESENTNPLVYSCHFGPGELKEAVKQAFAKLKDAKHVLKAFGFILLALVLIGGSVVFSGTRVTYNVKYGEKVYFSIFSNTLVNFLFANA